MNTLTVNCWLDARFLPEYFSMCPTSMDIVLIKIRKQRTQIPFEFSQLSQQQKDPVQNLVLHLGIRINVL